MDDRTMCIGYTMVYESYIAEDEGESGLLLEEFVCHEGNELRGLI